MRTSPEIRWAQVDDAQAVTELWSATARWLRARGTPLWQPEQFEPAATAQAIARRELVVAHGDSALCACALVTTSDPDYWPEQPAGSAWYVHKLAVARHAAGRGQAAALIDWIAAAARQEGIPRLRLDCDPRPALLDLYARLGFARYDPAPVVRIGLRVQRMQKQLTEEQGA